eukprot:1571392-Pleurochrysis_carterae.AAC.1
MLAPAVLLIRARFAVSPWRSARLSALDGDARASRFSGKVGGTPLCTLANGCVAHARADAP